jgi:hypothetical protein
MKVFLAVGRFKSNLPLLNSSSYSGYTRITDNEEKMHCGYQWKGH